jgi:hypothetical protein
MAEPALTVKSFTVEYAGVYDTYGTKVNIRAELVVSRRIILRRQQEWCDGVSIMDYGYPEDQPPTEPGAYVYENIDYPHVPFRLSFTPLGHVYRVRWEYLDTADQAIHSAEAETRFFAPGELPVLILGGAAAILILALAVAKLRKP